MTTPTYPQLKNAMIVHGLPVSPGAGWNHIDQDSFRIWTATQAYQTGTKHDQYAFNYGLAYPGLLPAIVSVVAAPYTSLVVESAASGVHPLVVTLTINEAFGRGISFAWDFGDSVLLTTSSKTVNHTYAAAGSYTPKCTPTINSIVQPQVSGAPIVVS